MSWYLFGLACALAGWLLGWIMGIQRTVTIYKALLREGAQPPA